jgi:hypothetical protein
MMREKCFTRALQRGLAAVHARVKRHQLRTHVTLRASVVRAMIAMIVRAGKKVARSFTCLSQFSKSPESVKVQ